MVLEKKNFVIVYDEKESYVPGVIDYLESKTNNIMTFFGLNSLKEKRKIIIFNDLELYKKHIEQFHEYRDYMCADTDDGNINLLSLEEAHKTKEHATMTVDDLKMTILHEFVHICQQECEVEHLEKDVIWFWEALATNLGNSEVFSKVLIKASNEEIEEFINLPQNYCVAFTIGNYLLDNYPSDAIIEYVKYPSKLIADSEKILNEAREWSNVRTMKR
jgi:hypothetical protein